jgi:hypothetical protein
MVIGCTQPAPASKGSERNSSSTPVAPVETSDEMWPDDLVAFWDWQGANFKTSTHGPAPYSFEDVGSAPVKVSKSVGPFGPGLDFGAGRVLRITPAKQGELNVAKAGNEVTVVAWIKSNQTTNNGGFLGGIWDEDEKRSYGLFDSLTGSSADGRVVGHVSESGGDTPGLDHSRDHSTTSRTQRTRLPADRSDQHYRMVAFTYDGSQALSYLDGLTDRGQVFRPADGGAAISRNPYLFEYGLNRDTESDFTVGMVNHSSGWINPFMGTHFGLAVFDRALARHEVRRLFVATKDPTAPSIDLRPNLQYVEAAPVAARGWRAFRSGLETSNLAYDSGASWYLLSRKDSPSFIARRSTILGASANEAAPGYIYFADDTGSLQTRLSEIDRIEFALNNGLAASEVRVILQVGASWFASEEVFRMKKDGANESNWKTAELKNLALVNDRTKWRTFDPSTSLVGPTPASDLPDGMLGGIGFWNGGAVSESVRIADIKVY